MIMRSAARTTTGSRVAISGPAWRLLRLLRLLLFGLAFAFLFALLGCRFQSVGAVAPAPSGFLFPFTGFFCCGGSVGACPYTSGRSLKKKTIDEDR